MRAKVELPDQRVVEGVPGDVVGRLRTAALRIDDPRVSEAHAMISLRGTELLLLALRGALVVDGHRHTEVALQPGLTVGLALGVAVRVLEVHVPAEGLALEGPGLGAAPLVGSVCTLLGEPPQLVPRFEPDGAAHCWSVGDGWRAAVRGGEPVDLRPGVSLQVGARALRVVAIPTLALAAPRTEARGRYHPATRIVARYDTVHLHPEGGAPQVVSGLPGRLLSELVSFGGPVTWDVLAAELWRGDQDRVAQRRKLDVCLARLRRKLQDGGIRTDLVRADGTGRYELFLQDGDQVEDAT